MKYTKLFRAMKAKEALPEMESNNWTLTEKERIEKGVCVQCGNKPSEETSFICRLCAEKETLDEIKNEIEMIRRQLIQSKCEK